MPRSTRIVLAIAGATLGIAQPQQTPPPPAPMPAVLRNYQPVTAERLKNPEATNWLMICYGL